jgi:predicted porin
MKKSLLAVAAIGAFASAAQAQSSVTVYGILDVGYQGGNSSVTNATSAGTGAGATINYPATTNQANANVKTTQSVLGSGAEQTSRLGFKGMEDLGGGRSAFFTAEFSLYPDQQTLSGNTAGGLKDRQSFVGLKQNGVGQFAVGTQYTLIFNAVSKTDADQQNNMIGSVNYNGQADSSLSSAANPQYGSNFNATTTRVSNALTLDTDNFGGFVGHALAVMNNSNGSAYDTSGVIAAGGNTNTNGWGLGADYTWNKLFVTADYQAFKQMTSSVNAANPSTLAAGTVGVFSASAAAGPAGAGNATATNGLSVATQPLNIQDNQAYVGATYDFGILKAYASWISRKASDTQNSSFYQKRQAEQIGVRSFWTPTIESWASAGIGTYTPFGSNQNSAHFNAWQLGSNYWLSKRTNLYAIYGQTAQAGSTYNTYSSSTGAINGTFTTNLNANSYAIGIRHTF